jgi:cyclopropane fatty-acyl-phospholipid synthase-like methyltransferase
MAGESMIYPRANGADGAAVAAHYDEIDRFYRAVWGTNLHHGYWQSGDESTAEAILNLTRLIAKQAQITTGSRVCDFGCGYGATARLFAQEYGAKVTGLTISRRQYELAQNTGGDDVNILLCDGLVNNFPAQSFDALVAIESSEHIADKAAFFQEAHRLLRPGGRLVVAAWLAREQATTFEARFLLEPICEEGRLPNMATAAEYLAMLQAAGFREAQSADLSRNVRKTWSICASRFIKTIGSNTKLRRELLQPDWGNRVFAKTVFRIWLAYRTGSMRYGIFSATK